MSVKALLMHGQELYQPAESYVDVRPGLTGVECNSAVIASDMDESQSYARSAPAGRFTLAHAYTRMYTWRRYTVAD